ncbi:MAG: IS110 family transposase [Actinomycetota bacterium]|nr:IS110 family transposase [Actinomycetota bacterium]
MGLDVHASTVVLAAVRGDELVEERTLPTDNEAVASTLARWPGVRACYEAGPTGFGLHRHLRERGIACEVVAPALVPRRPGDRVKTDRRDARQLARLYASGLLQPIEVPSPEREAARDLIRAREDARLDRMRDRHRMSKFMLRNGARIPGKSWGITRRAWLGAQSFERPAQQLTFETYLHALDLVDRRIEVLEREIAALAQAEPWRALVGRLRCLRGIDTLTALAIAVEVGDFDRFGSAEEFMAYVGLVPSERSSGDSRRQGSITKAGNSHLRRLLVEAAWNQRARPQVGAELARRQRGQDPLAVERAWRCQQRLSRRWRRMQGRGKPRQKIVVAVARELSGFVWATATAQPLRRS